jgi:hypothetical protein
MDWARTELARIRQVPAIRERQIGLVELSDSSVCTSWGVQGKNLCLIDLRRWLPSRRLSGLPPSDRNRRRAAGDLC